MGFIFGLIWIFILTLNLNEVVSDMMFLCSTIFITVFYLAIELRRLGMDIRSYAEVTCGAIYGTTEILKNKKEETNNE